MKKKLKWIIAGVVSLFLTTTITLSLLVLDPSFDNYVYEKNVETRLGAMFAVALKGANENKKINYHIGEEDLKVLLHFTSNQGNINVEINEDNYRFIIKDNFLFIPTRVIINTTLEKSDEGFVFHINSIKNGKLNTYGILNSTGKLQRLDLEKTFNEAGLSIKVDYSNAQITYAKEDLINDLNQEINFFDDELLGHILTHSSKSYDIDKGFNVSLDLSNNQENLDKSDSNLSNNHYGSYPSLLEKIRAEVNKYGFSKTDEFNNGTLEVTSFKEDIGISNFGEKAEPIKDVLVSRIEEKPISEYSGSSYNKEVAYLNEFDLDNVLKESKIIGKCSLFYSIDAGITYVTIDHIYSDIFTNDLGDAFINYTIGVNINGLETRIVIETKALDPINEFACDFVINNIYYGQETVSSSFKSYAKELLNRALSSVDYFVAKPKSNLVTINFVDLFDEVESLGAYKSLFYDSIGTRQFVVDSAALNEVGKLSIHFVR